MISSVKVVGELRVILGRSAASFCAMYVCICFVRFLCA